MHIFLSFSLCPIPFFVITTFFPCIDAHSTKIHSFVTKRHGPKKIASGQFDIGCLVFRITQLIYVRDVDGQDMVASMEKKIHRIVGNKNGLGRERKKKWSEKFELKEKQSERASQKAGLNKKKSSEFIHCALSFRIRVLYQQSESAEMEQYYIDNNNRRQNKKNICTTSFRFAIQFRSMICM